MNVCLINILIKFLFLNKWRYIFMGALGNHDIQQTYPDDITYDCLQNIYKEITNK